jgi:NarL family two-component system response regulator LiaR
VAKQVPPLKGIERMLSLQSNASTYEGRFLLACLSVGFKPSVLFLSANLFLLGAQIRSLKNTSDCIGCCLTAAEAIDILEINQPGLVIISGYSSNMSFQHAIDYVYQNCPRTRTVVFVENLDLACMPQSADAIIAEADVVHPDNPVLQALMALVSNATYRSPSIETLISLSNGDHDVLPENRIFLSLRDRQLLSGYLLGLTNKQMAERLNLSPRTIQTYSGNLLQKLGVNNRQKALAQALRIGYSKVEKMFLK